jgi:hypothetical protein
MTSSDGETEIIGGVILLDTASAADETFDTSFLERNGHPVVVCRGPAAGTVCPSLRGEGCDLFGKAHGVVFQLDLDVAQHRAILGRYRHLRPDLPIRLVMRPDQVDRYRDLLAGFEVLVREPSAADLDGFAAEVEASDRMAER